MSIIKVLLKDPDGIYDCLNDEIEDEELREKVQRKFFEYGDYCSIEIDTDTMTAIIVPNY